ncbi:translocation/assembly module TamB domain-containing protein [Taklimakanibacter lacteus]|uniref:translocation/assembly module TamB domain-containing protein n=1 Tax=Taklimakanibacter lacteus TaxID=2268456 RepID=UPI000E661DD3
MALKRAIRFILFALAGLVLLVAVLFGFIQTGPGKNLLASLAGSLASGNGVTVTVSGIEGFVPSNMRIRRIAAADEQGTFAEIEGIDLAWSPRALLNGMVSAETIAIRKIALERLPDLPPDPQAPPSSGLALPRLDIGRLDLAEIDIAEPVFGEPLRLSFTGSAQLVDPAQGLALDFALDRRDLPGRIAGKVNFVPDRQFLDIDIVGDEPQGGVIAGLARIDGEPPVKLTLKGKGGLDDFKAALSFRAGASLQAQGAIAIRRAGTGHAINADLSGEVAALLPAGLAQLFEGTTTLAAALTIDDAQRIAVEDARLRSAGFGVTLKGAVDTKTSQTDLRYKIIGGAAERFAGLVPGVQWQDVFVDGSLKGALAQPEIKAALTLSMPRAEGYGAEMVSATVEMLPQADGGFALSADGDAKGLEANDAKVKAVLGDTLEFAAAGRLAGDGKPVLTGATVKLAPLVADFSGAATPDGAKGKFRLGRLDLAALTPLAGRPLSGQVTAEADLDVSPQMLRVAGRGSSIGVSTGIASLDGLLKGPAELSGGVQRGADGVIVVENASLKAKDATLTVGGRIDRAVADLRADLALSDLALLDARVSGSVKATAAFSGTLDKLRLSADLSVPNGRAMGKPVEALQLAVTAEDLTGAPRGKLSLSGRIEGKPAQGEIGFAALPGNAYRVDPIDLSIGANKVSGALRNIAGGLAEGSLKIAAGNLAELSALVLTPLSGALDADISLSADQGKQSVAIKGKAGNLHVAGQVLGKATIDGTLKDALGKPLFDGELAIADSSAGSVRIDRAKLTASGTGSDSRISLDAVVAGTTISGEGQVAVAAETMTLTLRALALSKNGTRANLAGLARVRLAGSAVEIENFAMVSGKGRAMLSGTAGADSLALDVTLAALPLSLARLGGYEDDLRGTLAGTVKLQGRPQAPLGRYDIQIAGLSNPDIQRSGASPFDIGLKGDLSDGRAGIAMTIRNDQLQNMQVTGSVTLATLGLDLRARGEVALSIANAMLAASGNRLGGTASIDATVKGSASAPDVRGTVRIADGKFEDVVNGVAITRINGDITGEGRSLVLRSLKGRTSNGGSVTLSGRVTVDPGSGIPADLTVAFDNASLLASETARLVADGRIEANGPILSRPKVTGRVAVRKLDINLPDKLSGGAKPIAVRHVNKPAGKKLAGAKPPAPDKGKARATDSGFIADLDVTLSAPNGIFVRGMGIEAELGGDLTIRGTSNAPRSLGGFAVKRGRFDGFGKRLDFEKGLISFNGSLDPELDFVAQSESDGITAKVLISGPASAPKISFASTPELPQDEVISHLLFDRSASELSIGQAAQLAQTIAQLSGSGPGVLDKMRRSLGVDSLDVGTENGGEVGLGKRINDRVYLGVKQGTEPNSSKVTIDVDITKNIRAQGATGADGSAEVGIGAEWDY